MAAVWNKADLVVAEAMKWVGIQFRPGVEAQCAPFVRYVFAKAQVPVANAKNPTDLHLLGPGDTLGPDFANSFASEEVGRKVSLKDAQPGDIVMFANTYGDWKSGVITHVGIYTGKNMMVDRSTMEGPVYHRSVYHFGAGPCEIRRPHAYGAPRTRIEIGKGKVWAKKLSEPVSTLDVKVQMEFGVSVWINNTLVMVKEAYVKVIDKTTGDHYRLSAKGANAGASVNYVAVKRFHVWFKTVNGALNIKINGKEVGSRDAAVEIVHYG
jgi:hypothetical protein